MNYDNPYPWRAAIRRLIDQIVSNPRTSLAGATTIAAALLPKHAVTIGLIATGIGHILAKDGAAGSSYPTAEVNHAVDQVEAGK